MSISPKPTYSPLRSRQHPQETHRAFWVLGSPGPGDAVTVVTIRQQENFRHSMGAWRGPATRDATQVCGCLDQKLSVLLFVERVGMMVGTGAILVGMLAVAGLVVWLAVVAGYEGTKKIKRNATAALRVELKT